MWQWSKLYLFLRGIWSQIGTGSPSLVAAHHQTLNNTNWYYISSISKCMRKIEWKCLLAALRLHLLWHFPSIKIADISVHEVWWFCTWIIVFYVWITCLILFPTISNISTSVSNAVQLLFFRNPCHANLGTDKK